MRLKGRHRRGSAPVFIGVLCIYLENQYPRVVAAPAAGLVEMKATFFCTTIKTTVENTGPRHIRTYTRHKKALKNLAAQIVHI